MPSKVIIFDLDDTLYKEIDYLKSAYKEIAITLDKINSKALYNNMLLTYNNNVNVFEKLTEDYNELTKYELIAIYRHHVPDIELSLGAIELLISIVKLNYPIGLLTDGRSIQQRNKLKALSITSFFNDIIISEEFGTEKPSILNYQFFQEKYSGSDFFYIGDNFNKDFISPKKLGWTTIGLLNNGKNIHKQNINLSKEYLPKYFVKSLNEIKKIITL